MFLQDCPCPWHRIANSSHIRRGQWGGCSTWTTCRKGPVRALTDFSFLLAQAAQCLGLSKGQTAKQGSQRVSLVTDCQTLLPGRWLWGSPEGRSSATFSRKAWPEGEPILKRFLWPPHFLYPPIHISGTAALATYYLTSTQDLFLVKPWGWADIRMCCPFLFLFLYVSVIPCGWWGNHVWCAWLCVVFTVNAVAATFASWSLHWIFYQEGGERDNIAVAFWSLYFMWLSCGYWHALESKHIYIGIWLLDWWQVGRYFHWVMGLK